MSVVVTAVAPFGAEQYDAITERVMPTGALPEGCQLHVAGPIAEGWRVITVWESEDAFNQFREEKLLPALREVSGQEPGQAVQPQVDPVHRLITS
jgi:hypothetical protein